MPGKGSGSAFLFSINAAFIPGRHRRGSDSTTPRCVGPHDCLRGREFYNAWREELASWSAPSRNDYRINRLKKSNSLFTEAQGKLQWSVPFFDFLVFFLWSHPSNGSPKGKISLTGFSIKWLSKRTGLLAGILSLCPGTAHASDCKKGILHTLASCLNDWAGEWTKPFLHACACKSKIYLVCEQCNEFLHERDTDWSQSRSLAFKQQDMNAQQLRIAILLQGAEQKWVNLGLPDAMTDVTIQTRTAAIPNDAIWLISISHFLCLWEGTFFFGVHRLERYFYLSKHRAAKHRNVGFVLDKRHIGELPAGLITHYLHLSHASLKILLHVCSVNVPIPFVYLALEVINFDRQTVHSLQSLCLDPSPDASICTQHCNHDCVTNTDGSASISKHVLPDDCLNATFGG